MDQLSFNWAAMLADPLFQGEATNAVFEMRGISQNKDLMAKFFFHHFLLFWNQWSDKVWIK